MPFFKTKHQPEPERLTYGGAVLDEPEYSGPYVTGSFYVAKHSAYDDRYHHDVEYDLHGDTIRVKYRDTDRARIATGGIIKPGYDTI
jgi:hypothetical protein